MTCLKNAKSFLEKQQQQESQQQPMMIDEWEEKLTSKILKCFKQMLIG